MRFDIDETVYIVKIVRDQEAGWADKMDDTFLKHGTIIDIHDNHGYLISFPNMGDVEYYYNEEAVGDYDEYYEAKEKHIKNEQKAKWFLSPISKTVFKFIGLETSGFSIFEDKDKNIVTNEYFRLDPAPKECKDFDFIHQGRK